MNTTTAYEAVAAEYEDLTGEPLVAADDWVAPLYDACKVAVDADPNADETRTDAEQETVTRTAAVIAIITHGVAAVKRA